MMNVVNTNTRPIIAERSFFESCSEKLMDLVKRVQEIFMQILHTITCGFFKRAAPINPDIVAPAPQNAGRVPVPVARNVAPVRPRPVPIVLPLIPELPDAPIGGAEVRVNEADDVDVHIVLNAGEVIDDQDIEADDGDDLSVDGASDVGREDDLAQDPEVAELLGAGGGGRLDDAQIVAMVHGDDLEHLWDRLTPTQADRLRGVVADAAAAVDIPGAQLAPWEMLRIMQAAVNTKELPDIANYELLALEGDASRAEWLDTLINTHLPGPTYYLFHNHSGSNFNGLCIDGEQYCWLTKDGNQEFRDYEHLGVPQNNVMYVAFQIVPIGTVAL